MLLEIAASVHLADLKPMVRSDGWSVPKGWGPLVEIQFLSPSLVLNAVPGTVKGLAVQSKVICLTLRFVSVWSHFLSFPPGIAVLLPGVINVSCRCARPQSLWYSVGPAFPPSLPVHPPQTIEVSLNSPCLIRS